MSQNIELNKRTEKEENQKKNLTVFGQETEFDGELEFTDNLVITGKFSGKINATGDLEVDKTALCDVESIKVNSLVISGKVKGNIEAKERVEMCSGSSVCGDVVTGRIRIADNVDLKAVLQCCRIRRMLTFFLLLLMNLNRLCLLSQICLIKPAVLSL